MICITNRKLFFTEEEFFNGLAKVLEKNPEKIILREKDLSENEYQKLLERILAHEKLMTLGIEKKLVLHTYVDQLSYFREKGYPLRGIQLPYDKFLRQIEYLKESLGHSLYHSLNQLPESALMQIEVGVSIHSLEEAIEVERLGGDYVIAGHIFQTDCKKGKPPRGLSYLKEICENVQIPVYGIGGIDEKNLSEVMDVGATGGCMMSGWFR